MCDVIYLDNNATTALDPRVLEAMRPFLTALAGNPSSRHTLGRYARQAIERARRQIAEALRANPAEVTFTSGATEANNLAIFSLAGPTPGRVLVSPVEHPSALEPCRVLARRGYTVETLAVNADGRACDLAANVRTGDRLLVIQLANSETGCIQRIADLAQQAAAGSLIHCDAVQAVGKIPVDFSALGVTSLSLSGHKLHGPAGVGALVLRRGAPARPTLFGGHQQHGFRPGTEPVASIVGLGAAVELAVTDLSNYARRLAELRDRLELTLLACIPDVVRNGAADGRLPNTANLSFPGAPAEALLMQLDLAGVCCSAGAACASGSLEPSTVLRAMSIGGTRLESALRFSVGRFTTDDEIDRAAALVAQCVEKTRARFRENPLVAPKAR